MTTTYIATSGLDPICDAVEGLLSKSYEVVRVTPSEVAQLESRKESCLVISEQVRQSVFSTIPRDFGMVHFLGCRPPLGLLEQVENSDTVIAGISPSIAPRVANRVIGFTGPLQVKPMAVWGIVGLGTTGLEVARKVTSNRSSVSIADIRTPRSGILNELGIRRKTLDLLVAESDVVTLHLYAGPTADPLISKRELSLMKTNAVLINTSDSSVVDEQAVLDALRSGQLAGYATDCPGPIFEVPHESLVSDGKLVVTTNPLTSQIGVSVNIARLVDLNVRAFSNGEKVKGCYEPVDYPIVGDPSFWSSRMSPRQD